jgi:hypothetical protein
MRPLTTRKVAARHNDPTTIQGRWVIYTSAGVPYGGGGACTISVRDVAALGKMIARGSQACARFLARQHNGDIVSLRACDQHKDVERWLRRIAKRIDVGYINSWEEGWRLVWSDITPEDGLPNSAREV